MKKTFYSLFAKLAVVIVCGVILADLVGYEPVVQAVQSGPKRTVPDTTSGIHVWNDQMLPRTMSDEQIRFAATHYDGSMKMVRSGADRLRAYNPNFLILHYRLGQALGYRMASGDCDPNGDYIQIVEGNDWRQEWPGDNVVQPDWFYPYAGSPRVFWCAHGSYLMDTDNAGWRNYWLGEVTRQMAANDNDGVFADSVAVPTHLGPHSFRPNFPAYDQAFEDQWSARIQRWLTTAKQQFGDQYLLIPNAGSWITTRDKTDYSAADGVMIERFGRWNPSTPHDLPDWQVQMNRILGLVRQDKIIIANNVVNDPNDVQTRMFLLTNYLLVKGKRTFINIELGIDPEWFPEYEFPIGSPTDAVSANVDGWRDAASGLYRRAYTNGLVVLNPTGETRTLSLGETLNLAQPSGGGNVPESGVPTGSVSYQPVSSVTLEPYSGAVLLRSTSGDGGSGGGNGGGTGGGTTGGTVTSVNAATAQVGEVAPESIVMAFGTNLTATTQAAVSATMPTNLGGTTVKVRDSSGTERLAPLFYVSPTQINYLVPAGTASGAGVVIVTSESGATSTGAIQVAPVAPGIFSAFPLSTGVGAGGTYLILYGTGIRQCSTLDAVKLNVGGLEASVVYAGPQGQYAGLDQVNAILPASLAGRGSVNLVLTVDRKPSNAVSVTLP